MSFFVIASGTGTTQNHDGLISGSRTIASSHSRPPQPVLSAVQAKKMFNDLGSQNRKRVIFTLEGLKIYKPDEMLIHRIKYLAEESADHIVRGYARLLAADWGIALVQKPVDWNISDQSAPGMLRPSVAPAQSHSAANVSKRNSRSSISLSVAGPASLNQRPANPAQVQAIHYALPSNRANSNATFTENLTDQSLIQSPLGSYKELTPQVPFWLADSTSTNSLPADVDEDILDFDNNIQRSDTGIESLTNGLEQDDDIRPGILDRPIDAPADAPVGLSQNNYDDNTQRASYFSYEFEAPLGNTGPSGVLPTEFQQSDHFVPIEDRWRLGFPAWDRYGKGHPALDDYPFKEGSILDPYNQNVLKGDYPLIGQHIFYSITAELLAVHEFRQTPTATTPFESTKDPFSAGFFGDPDQLFYTPFFRFAFDLFHGNAAFKPVDWRFRLTPVFNVNYLDVGELAIVNPDVRRGTDRLRNHASLEEWFVEAKLADIGPDYDFVSARVGSQFFVSDFRGFIFRDFNRAVRLFGTRLSNRDQFNALWFDQAEKNTNSELNSFADRHQNIVILNYFRQDFVFPGYVAQASFHYNRDKPSTHFDDNDNLVRPDPVGVFKPHQVDAYYLGLAGEGHIKRINILNQFYVALGEDSTNPIGGTEQQINAYMAALELSYDRDWIRFRGSYFFASGDDDPNDGKAEGFDTILDDPIFAGGEFSYWQRQAIRLFGTNLVQRKSLVPNLRSSKTQGQSNFVNPGLHLFNLGTDIEFTPKTRLVANANYLFFDHTEVLETYTFQNKINREIGTDLSLGLEHRPLLNDNAIIVCGVASLIPSQGLRDLFGAELPEDIEGIGVGNELHDETPRLTSAFVEVVLTY